MKENDGKDNENLSMYEIEFADKAFCAMAKSESAAAIFNHSYKAMYAEAISIAKYRKKIINNEL